MTNSILVVAPHADDETLGCGGTLLRHRARGAEIHWVLVGEMTAGQGYDQAVMAERESEIKAVAEAYNFASTTRLGMTAGALEQVPTGDLVAALARCIHKTMPHTVYLPFWGDAHSDHQQVAHAALAATKSFRAPSVRNIFAYETISETEFAHETVFAPNYFVDVTDHLDRKLEIASLYVSEIKDPPFPRSLDALKAQALLRGGSAGVMAAEAFMLVRGIEQ